MIARGLRPPLLVVSDGAPGLIPACELVLADEPAPAVPHPSLPATSSPVCPSTPRAR